MVISHAPQILISDTKMLPWNYTKTVVTYKRKEVVEEINEVIWCGRYHTPEELKKPKQNRDKQMPLKKSVTDEEVEEFLKKIKVHKYSIVDQLRNTLA